MAKISLQLYQSKKGFSVDFESGLGSGMIRIGGISTEKTYDNFKDMAQSIEVDGVKYFSTLSWRQNTGAVHFNFTNNNMTTVEKQKAMVKVAKEIKLNFGLLSRHRITVKIGNENLSINKAEEKISHKIAHKETNKPNL